VPTLQPGDIVIADNLRAHKVARIQRAIAVAGATLWYLPPHWELVREGCPVCRDDEAQVRLNWNEPLDGPPRSERDRRPGPGVNDVPRVRPGLSAPARGDQVRAVVGSPRLI
jgi:hypothetical protein